MSLIKKYDFQISVLLKCLLIFVCLFVLRADLRESVHKVDAGKTNSERIAQFNNSDLRNYIEKNMVGNPEYLPLTKTMAPNDVVGHIYEMINDGQNYEKKVLKNGYLQLSWNTRTTNVTLPIVFYRQSVLIVNGKKVSPKCNEIGMPIVQAKKGKNTAILSFKTPTWFTALLYISILSWVLLIIYGVFRWVKIVKK